jgi:hypothetical protein
MFLLFGTQLAASQEKNSVWGTAIFRNILPKPKSVFAVAVSTDASKVNLAQVDCLSLDPNWAHVDRIDHSMTKACAKLSPITLTIGL